MSVDFPPAFVARMREQLGNELPPFLEALAHPEAGLRVNTLRLPPEDFARLAPFELTKLGFPPEGFVLPTEVPAGRHPYHSAGLYYLQDPGAMIVGALVDPQPGERVLDLAAAPGGKATHLAARMGGAGLLVANDVSRARALELSGNLERMGVLNGVVTALQPDRLADHFGEYFDRVLVDAPCSGESMFHKSAAARKDWSEASVLGCASRQAEILTQAARLVVPGGLLVYSTCTFSNEENEGAIGRFLEAHPEFTPEELQIPGLEGSAGNPSPGYRIWPHRVPGAGHFVALLRREETGFRGWGSASTGSRRPDHQPLLEEFLNELAPEWNLPWERVIERNGEIYLQPDPLPPLEGLRAIRSGLWLGTLQKGRFIPSHSLAMAIEPEPVVRQVELTVDDERVSSYLAGETIVEPGGAGWVLVTIDGFALGWGKRTGDVVKNHYPKGLRRPVAKG